MRKSWLLALTAGLILGWLLWPKAPENRPVPTPKDTAIEAARNKKESKDAGSGHPETADQGDINTGIHPATHYEPAWVNNPKALTISGTLSDNTGNPIPGARVVLAWVPQHFATQSDASGSYSLAFPVPDRWPPLGVDAPGFRPREVPLAQLFEDGRQEAVLDVVLEAGFWVAGTVVSHDDKPLADVKIKASSRFSWRPPVFHTTSEDGRFFIENLCEQVRFDFAKQGHSSVFYKTLPLNQEDTKVTLPEPGLILGRVTDRETGEPISSFTLTTRASFIRGGFSRTYAREKVTRENHEAGHFEITGLNAGIPATLSLKAEGYLEETLGPVEVLPVSRAGRHEVTLTTFALTLRGRVVDEGDHPIGGAQVSLLVSKNKHGDALNFSRWEYLDRFSGYMMDRLQTKSGDDGSFQFDGLAPGYPINLFVKASGYGPRVISGLEQHPTEAWGDFVVTMAPASRLVGKINRESLKGRLFVQVRVAGYYDAVNIGRGQNTFVLEGLPMGQAVVELWKRGLSNSEVLEHRDLELHPAQTHPLNFGFDEVYDISGRIFWNERPLGNGHVYLLASGENIWHETKTDRSGRFHFERNKPDDYTLKVFHPRVKFPDVHNDHPQQAHFRVEDADYDYEFHFQEKAQLTGQVNGFGSPWKVRLKRKAGKHWEQDQPLSNGPFVFDNFPAGEYQMFLSNFSLSESTQILLADNLKLSGEEVVDLGTIAPEEGTSILKLLFESEEAQVFPRVSVLLVTSKARGRAHYLNLSRSPGPNGLLEIPNLPADDFSLFVNAAGGTWFLEPRMVKLALVPDHVEEVHLKTVRLTILELYASKLNINKITFTHEGGAVFSAEASDESFSQPEDPFALSVQVRRSQVHARNLPEGKYHLLLEHDAGFEEREFHLKKEEASRIIIR